MTGSWGPSLVDRSHTDCICTTEPPWHATLCCICRFQKPSL
jgi:hypothetical protein